MTIPQQVLFAEAGSAYTGPKDAIATSAIGWWGMRGYSRAYCTGAGPAIDIFNGSTTKTINIKSNGDLDVVTAIASCTAAVVTGTIATTVLTVSAVTSGTVAVGNWLYGTGITPGTFISSNGTGSGGTGTYNLSQSNTVSSGETITCLNGVVSKIYDQTGGGHHMTQATGSKRPAFHPAVVSSLPGLIFLGSSSQELRTVTNSFSQANPYTLSSVSNRTSNTTTSTPVLWLNGNSDTLIGHRLANQGVLSGPTNGIVATSVNDNAPHSMNGVCNGASSSINVDGTVTTGTVDSNTIATAGIGGQDAFGQPLTGYIMEAGIWASALSSGNVTSIKSNQRTYWGF